MDNQSSDFQKDFLNSIETPPTAATPTTITPLVAQSAPASTNKKSFPKWLFIVIPAILLIVVGSIVGIIIINKNSQGELTQKYTSLACTNGGDVKIAISFDNKGLLSYEASNVPFDFENQKTLAKTQGVIYTMMDFARWFENHVQDGHCQFN